MSAAPKTKDYSVVPDSSGPRRDFRISVGLREGWDADGRVFDVSEAVRTASAWMKRRVVARSMRQRHVNEIEARLASGGRR